MGAYFMNDTHFNVRVLYVVGSILLIASIFKTSVQIRPILVENLAEEPLYTEETPEEKQCTYGKYAKWPYTDEYPFLHSNRRKLLYIKTPKSASSTISHILQRYTDRENMTVAYPDFKNDQWVLETEKLGQDARERALRDNNSTQVDAIVSHVVYNSTWVNAVLETERPFRITSVRDPIARSWSMYLHGLEFGIPEFTFGAKNPMAFAHLLELNSQSSYMSGFGSGINMNDTTQVINHYDHIIPSDRVLEGMVTLGPKIGLIASDLLYFSQKTSFHKNPLDLVSRKHKRRIDSIMSQKTNLDIDIFDMAHDNLDEEMKRLPDKIKEILQDVPAMVEEIKPICADIHPEDESCLSPEEVRWDGNAMCLFRCIQQWAKENIYCNT